MRLTAYNAPCAIAVKHIVRHKCVMARDDPHFRLRIAEDLKRRIERAAEANHRSINAEISARLEASFEPRLAAGETQADFLQGIAKLTEQLRDVDLFEWINLMKQLNEKLGRPSDDHQAAMDYAHSTRKTGNAKAGDKWDWDSLPKDNLENIPKSRRETKKKA